MGLFINTSVTTRVEYLLIYGMVVSSCLFTWVGAFNIFLENLFATVIDELLNRKSKHIQTITWSITLLMYSLLNYIVLISIYLVLISILLKLLITIVRMLWGKKFFIYFVIQCFFTVTGMSKSIEDHGYLVQVVTLVPQQPVSFFLLPFLRSLSLSLFLSTGKCIDLVSIKFSTTTHRYILETIYSFNNSEGEKDCRNWSPFNGQEEIAIV